MYLKPMIVPIIICTHRSERYNDLVEAIDSLKVQSYNKSDDEIQAAAKVLKFGMLALGEVVEEFDGVKNAK